MTIDTLPITCFNQLANCVSVDMFIACFVSHSYKLFLVFVSRPLQQFRNVCIHLAVFDFIRTVHCRIVCRLSADSRRAVGSLNSIINYVQNRPVSSVRQRVIMILPLE